MPDPANPQHLNRYSYVTNNPLRYSDPTGHMMDDGGGIGGGGCGLVTPCVGGGNGGSGGTPAPSNTPQTTPVPTVPAPTNQSGSPLLPNSSETPAPMVSNLPILSTQTPTVPPGWSPPSQPYYYGLDTLFNICAGPAVPGDPSCSQIAQNIGQLLPVIGLAAVEPGPVVEGGLAYGYVIQQTCQNIDCSIGMPQPYTPYPVTSSPTLTIIPSPTITPTATLPYITPTYATPSSTSTFWYTPAP